jgi:hypothetical protein
MRKLLFFALVLGGLYAYWRLRRALFLFELVVNDGRIVKSQGRIPPRLLSDVSDIIARTDLHRVRIRCVVRGGRPALQFDGEIGEGTQQMLRNVVGQFDKNEIRGSRGGRG